MYIIIAGAGLVGGNLARRLIENKHDVVVIDKDKESCEKLYAETGAMTIHGSVTTLDTLKEAAMERADVAIAATGFDSDNLAFSIMAKSYKVSYIIARMRNPDYERAYKEAGVTKLVKVTNLLVEQMMVDIENPHAERIKSLSGGEMDIYKVNIPQRTTLAGKSIMEIFALMNCSHLLFLARRDVQTKKLEICHGDHYVKQEDELYFIADHQNVTRIIKDLTRQFKNRRKS